MTLRNAPKKYFSDFMFWSCTVKPGLWTCNRCVSKSNINQTAKRVYTLGPLVWTLFLKMCWFCLYYNVLLSKLILIGHLKNSNVLMSVNLCTSVSSDKVCNLIQLQLSCLYRQSYNHAHVKCQNLLNVNIQLRTYNLVYLFW